MNTIAQPSITTHESTALLGRILVGIVFLSSGLSKLAAPVATLRYISAMGLPLPLLGFAIAVLIEVGAGLVLNVGWRTRAVAALLSVFTVATALIFHHQFGDQNQLIHFLKNIAMTGGLLQIVAFGAGHFSVDARQIRPPFRAVACAA